MKKIVLRASGVASPRKVRYLHDGHQLGNIFSEVNLPLMPFVTSMGKRSWCSTLMRPAASI